MKKRAGQQPGSPGFTCPRRFGAPKGTDVLIEGSPPAPCVGWRQRYVHPRGVRAGSKTSRRRRHARPPHLRLPSLPPEVLREECIRELRKTLYDCLPRLNRFNHPPACRTARLALLRRPRTLISQCPPWFTAVPPAAPSSGRGKSSWSLPIPVRSPPPTPLSSPSARHSHLNQTSFTIGCSTKILYK